MAEIGTAYVTLLPSAKGFADATAKEMGAAGTSGGTVASKGFKGAFIKGAAGIGAAVGGMFAIDKVKDFFVTSVDEARESQKVAALTAAVIKSTGGAAQVSAKQIGDLANSISSKTGIDDEAIQSGSNLLLTFRNIKNEAGKGNDIFNQTTKSMVDLAAAMGKDPKSAAIQLGKALNDPVKGSTALARSGIQLSDGQKDLIKKMVASGNTMGAQKVILKELRSEFGGAAAAQATAGEKMSVSWKNLQEQIGTALLPVLDKVETVITTKIIPAISKFIDEFQSGRGTGGQFADVLKQVYDVFQVLWPIVKAIGTFLLSSPKVIIAIAAAYFLWHSTLTAMQVVQAVQLIQLKLATEGTIENTIATKAASAATKIWSGVQIVFNAIMAGNPIALVVLAIIALIAVIILVIKYHRQIGAFIARVWGKVKDAIVAAWRSVGTFISKAWANIKKVIVNAVTSVVRFIKQHWGLIASILGGPLVAAIIVIVKNWGKIKAAISRAIQAVLGAVRAGWAKITGAVRQAAANTWDAIKSLPSKLLSLGGAMANAGRSIIQQFVNGMKNAAGIVSGIAGNVWNTLRGLLDGAISKINAALEFTIKVGPKSFTINPPDIPQLARGGRAGGSVVEVGDGGWESIVPDRLMVSALSAAAQAGAGLRGGGNKMPDRLALVVDGYEFSAYVDSRADGRVSSAGHMEAQRGRAAWR